MIQFVDLDQQYQSIKTEVLSEIQKVIESKEFIQGRFVETFCKNFSEMQGVKYSVGCSNGTSAITVALRALDIGLGDEVITVNNSFFATPEAICEVGATPVFVDCEENTYQINTAQIESKITSKTKAIIPVHLYGNPCNIEEICKIAKKYNLKIIEDSAQAHLATQNGKGIGSFGDISTFSFYPGKNLGAYGDAGMICCNDEKLYTRIKMLVDHGRTKKYEHEILAGNFRMDAIQAAVLNVKLKYLPKWTEARIKNAELYDKLFTSSGLKFLQKYPSSKCVYHIYLIEVSNRDQVMKHLKEHKISCGVHYPIPLHRQPALNFLKLTDDQYPVSSSKCERILSLPMYPELTQSEIQYIVSKVLEVAHP